MIQSPQIFSYLDAINYNCDWSIIRKDIDFYYELKDNEYYPLLNFVFVIFSEHYFIDRNRAFNDDFESKVNYFYQRLYSLVYRLKSNKNLTQIVNSAKFYNDYLKEVIDSLPELLKNYKYLYDINTRSYNSLYRIYETDLSAFCKILMIKKQYLPFVITELLLKGNNFENILPLCEFWVEKKQIDVNASLRDALSNARSRKIKIVIKENLLDEVTIYTKIPKFTTFEETQEFNNVILNEWFNKSKEGTFF